MRILLITTKFRHPDGSPWLLSELAAEFLRSGHEVTVLNVEWSGKKIMNPTSDADRSLTLKSVEAIDFGGGKFSLACRWIFSSMKIVPALIMDVVRRGKYDLFVGFSPCVAVYAAIPIGLFLSRDSCLVYWDFFPIHNQEISRKIPSPALPVLKKLEAALTSGFRRVGCMSRGGVRFFEAYFGRSKRQSIEVVPIWTSIIESPQVPRASIREMHGIGNDSIVFIFGGQLVAGRGIAEMCEAIILAHKKNNRIKLIVCGAGPLSTIVLDYMKKYGDVVGYVGSLSRNDYLGLVGASDVGVVCTVAEVSAPSFPSKSLDYFSCRLPIVASLEAVSDFGEIISRYNMGISCLAGNVKDMADSMISIAENEEGMRMMGENGYRYLREFHAVDKVARLITGECRVS